jgi:hypothetical protein
VAPNDKRFKDTAWTVNVPPGTLISYEGAQLCVLMDIRDELKEVNKRLTALRVDVGPVLHDTRAATKRIDKRLAMTRRLSRRRGQF